MGYHSDGSLPAERGMAAVAGMARTYSAPITLYTFSGPDGQYPIAQACL
jgi:hypothetical protein